MNQNSEENRNNEIEKDSSSGKVINGSRLDQAFPSLLTLGLLVSAVIVLSLVSGWKVVNLGLEEAKLDRDIKANKAIREEIPRLQNEENELRKKRNPKKKKKNK